MPGDRLPSEAALAKQFMVGRQTVREALRILELSGFIAVHSGAGGGAVVKDTLLSSISSLMTDAFQLQKITTQDLTAGRLAVEKAILPEAILHAKDSDIASLRQNVTEAKRKLAQKMPARADNMEFHTLLAVASKNGVFLVIQKAMSAVTNALIGRLKPDAETSVESIRSHEAIVDAIEARDCRKAMAALEAHIVEVGKRLSTLAEGKSEYL